MESLIRQTRSRYSNTGQEHSGRGRTISPQKSQPSIGEKQRSQSWLRRQFSRQMSWDYDYTDDIPVYPTAVAAAAFAVYSLEDSRIRDQNKTAAYGPEDTSSTSTNNSVELRGILRRRSVSFSDEIPNTSSRDQDAKMPISSSTSGLRMSEKDVVPASSIKKKPSFVEHHPSMETTRTRSITSENVVPNPDQTPPRQSTPQAVETKRQYSPRPGDTLADAWEKSEMIRIEERYEKLRTRIQRWETKKKEKATRRREKTQNEISDKKRAKFNEKHRRYIAKIEEIAGGAREQAKENRRNEEFKVKTKANKIRATGKLPSKCLCF